MGLRGLLAALFMTVKNRGRVHNWLGSLGSSEETRAAALLAAVVGGMDAKQAFESAQRAFSGISFDVLSIDDFTHSDLAGKEARDLDLKARTTHGLKLGEVDAFLSHSWRDDPHAKWASRSRPGPPTLRSGATAPAPCCLARQGVHRPAEHLGEPGVPSGVPLRLQAGCSSCPALTYVHRLW